MTNLDSIFKSRDITLLTKVHLVKATVFLWSCMDVRVGLCRKLSTEELMVLNCVVGFFFFLKVSFNLLVHFTSFQVFLIAEFESTFYVIFTSFYHV